MNPLPFAFVAAAEPPVLVGADTAWMLVATALVLLMTPGLAFFYGGLVRAKNALNTMMMSLGAIAAAGLAWALLGYSLAFAEGNGALGGLAYTLLEAWINEVPREVGRSPATVHRPPVTGQPEA